MFKSAFGGSPSDKKSLINHESVSVTWQRDSARGRSQRLRQKVSIRVINANDSRMEWKYGANFVTIFIKQMQHLENKHKVICKYKTLFE